MSILSVLPTGWLDDYYQPDDDLDEDDDAPCWPVEAFTVAAWGGWWSAAPDLSDE